MIFFVANDGTIINNVPSPVYQGASNANTIYLVAPFAENLSVTVIFKTPNGVWTSPALMTANAELEGIVNEKSGKAYSIWSYDIPNTITKYSGTVMVQFFFYGAQRGVMLASSSTTFPVGKGVPIELPATPSQNIYEQILNAVSGLQQKFTDLEPIMSIAWGINGPVSQE